MISYCIFFGGITLFTSNINVVQVHRNLHKTISMSNNNNNKRVMINNNGMHNGKVITLNTKISVMMRFWVVSFQDHARGGVCVKAGLWTLDWTRGLDYGPIFGPSSGRCFGPTELNSDYSHSELVI